MDKRVVGVIGAITGQASLDGAAQAAAPATPNPDAMNARSFAQLLDPIPNAVAMLQAADAAAAARDGAVQDDVQVAQVYVVPHHHHHHHRYRRYHHHHHHHRAVIRVPGVRIGIGHHHHHHHHHNY